MSKFLFISTYDLRRNTSGNIRTVALMNSLHDAGHIVHCLFVPTNNVSDKSIYDNLIKIDKLITFPRTEVFFVAPSKEPPKEDKSISGALRGWLIKTYSKLSVYDVFRLPLFKLKKGDLSELDDTYDYIVSSSEPRSSHLFAEKVIKMKKYQAKWILYWGDPMSNDVASDKLFGNREAKEEHRLISVSDISVYTNPCAVSYMKGKYPKMASKITWIPTTDFKKDNSVVETGDVAKIGYFGDYRQMYRNIDPFYQACIENKLDAVIIGGGDRELRSEGTVKVHGRMSRDEIKAYEQECGILIVLENFSKTGNCIQVPGKLYHYGLTYKYILVITESSNIAKEYECFDRFIFVPNVKDRIAGVIKDIQSGKYASMKIGPVEGFKYEKIANDFISVIR